MAKGLQLFWPEPTSTCAKQQEHREATCSSCSTHCVSGGSSSNCTTKRAVTTREVRTTSYGMITMTAGREELVVLELCYPQLWGIKCMYLPLTNMPSVGCLLASTMPASAHLLHGGRFKGGGERDSEIGEMRWTRWEVACDQPNVQHVSERWADVLASLDAILFPHEESTPLSFHRTSSMLGGHQPIGLKEDALQKQPLIRMIISKSTWLSLKKILSSKKATMVKVSK